MVERFIELILGQHRGNTEEQPNYPDEIKKCVSASVRVRYKMTLAD